MKYLLNEENDGTKSDDSVVGRRKNSFFEPKYKKMKSLVNPYIFSESVYYEDLLFENDQKNFKSLDNYKKIKNIWKKKLKISAENYYPAYDLKF